MTKIVVFIGVIALVMGFLTPVVKSQEYGDNDRAALAKALSEGKITLIQGIAASGKHGKAISVKYELDNGKLQLSVYTEKAGKFFEVIVNHKTGKVLKAEAITEGDDLKNAESQSSTLAKMKGELKTSIGKALKANKGFKAVSAIPSLQEDKPVVKIELIKGGKWKSVTQGV